MRTWGSKGKAWCGCWASSAGQRALYSIRACVGAPARARDTAAARTGSACARAAAGDGRSLRNEQAMQRERRAHVRQLQSLRVATRPHSTAQRCVACTALRAQPVTQAGQKMLHASSPGDCCRSVVCGGACAGARGDPRRCAFRSSVLTEHLAIRHNLGVQVLLTNVHGRAAAAVDTGCYHLLPMLFRRITQLMPLTTFSLHFGLSACDSATLSCRQSYRHVEFAVHRRADADRAPHP